MTAVGVAIAWAFPVYWMVNSSFLTPLTISRLTPTFLPFGGTLQNYREVMVETSFSEALQTSILVVAIALVVCIAFATLAAFAISRFRFRGRTSFVLTIILVQMLPAEAMFIAQYVYSDVFVRSHPDPTDLASHPKAILPVTPRNRQGQFLGTIWPRVRIPRRVGVALATIVPIIHRDYWCDAR